MYVVDVAKSRIENRNALRIVKSDETIALYLVKLRIANTDRQIAGSKYERTLRVLQNLHG